MPGHGYSWGLSQALRVSDLCSVIKCECTYLSLP